MVYKVFLDTNIVLDLFHHERPFYADAIELFYHLDNKEIIAFYSESVVTTMSYILRKTMKPPQINRVDSELNRKIDVLSCSQPLILGAVSHNPPDFEDALLYEIALEHHLGYFITSNTKDFIPIQNTRLPVLKAKELNAILIRH